MSYSCSAIANFTLDALQKLVRSNDSANCFIDKDGLERFWEIGRENLDGSITGRVFIFADGDTKGEHALRVAYPKGSFKIDKNGRIQRFSGIRRGVQNKAELDGYFKYQDTFGHAYITN